MTIVVFITENKNQANKNTDTVTNKAPSQYNQNINHKRKWRITVKPRIIIKLTAIATAKPIFTKLKKGYFPQNENATPNDQYQKNMGNSNAHHVEMNIQFIIRSIIFGVRSNLSKNKTCKKSNAIFNTGN